MKGFSDSNIDELYEMLVLERSKSLSKEEFTGEELAYLLLNIVSSCHQRGEHERCAKALAEVKRLKPGAGLLLSLAEEQPSLTAAVMKSAGELEYTEAVGMMKGALDEGDEHAKLCAIEALARLGKTKPIAKRLKSLSLDSARVFDHAVSALKERRSRRAGAELRKLARHKDAEVRRRVTEALALFGGEASLCEVGRRLDDKEFAVRNAAVDSIVLLKPSAKSLDPLLKSRKAHLRWAGLRLLSKLGNSMSAKMALPFLLDRYSHVRKAAAEVVEKFAKPAYECDEQVYDKGRTVFETVMEHKRLKLLRQNDSLDSRDSKERREMALSRKEVKQAQRDERHAQKGVHEAARMLAR